MAHYISSLIMSLDLAGKSHEQVSHIADKDINVELHKGRRHSFPQVIAIYFHNFYERLNKINSIKINVGNLCSVV